jgi:hypothetical protein
MADMIVGDTAPGLRGACSLVSCGTFRHMQRKGIESGIPSSHAGVSHIEPSSAWQKSPAIWSSPDLGMRPPMRGCAAARSDPAAHRGDFAGGGPRNAAASANASSACRVFFPRNSSVRDVSFAPLRHRTLHAPRRRSAPTPPPSPAGFLDSRHRRKTAHRNSPSWYARRSHNPLGSPVDRSQIS